MEAASPAAQSDTRLRQYLNARVSVYYNNQTGVSDTGVLTYMDSQWIELTKDNNERLLMPLLAIRIIKLIEPSSLDGDAGILLRPAEGQAPRQIPRE